MNSYQSIATINSPEFINLQPLDINPMMSKCEIKVLYLGKNRNGTSINKQAATEMAKTLRGAPIVGYYREEKGDFFDHGDQVIYDGEGVHFKTLTKPYGFVSPDAEVWFQEFEEFDETGESTVRTYLMTTGYLWTGQFQEAQQLFNEGGKPQSMELDENSLTGFWSKDENSECEFFIINDAIFSKLCILGDDVEPCFEGASVTAPNISKNFTLDDDFKKTLYEMMKELQYTLQGGNYKVEDDVKKKSADSSAIVEPEEVIEQPVETPTEPEENNSTDNTVDNSTVNSEEDTSQTDDNTGADAGNNEDAGVDTGDSGNTDASGDGGDGGDSGAADYAKADEEKEDDKEEEKKDDDKEEEDDEKKKYSLLLTQFEELQKSFTQLQEQADSAQKELAQFKEYAEKVENEKKDALIEEFYMLSADDKKDVIEHKAEYTLDEIKSKLAVICFDKKVAYTAADEKDNIKDMTVVIDSSEQTPAWLVAVDNHKAQ